MDAHEPELRVRLASGETGLIIGNSHTFRGRFEVSLSTSVRMSCSIRDVVPETSEARWWLAGFMAGMEPSPYDVLGEEYDAALPDDSPLIQRWRSEVQKFHATGLWLDPIIADD